MLYVEDVHSARSFTLAMLAAALGMAALGCWLAVVAVQVVAGVALLLAGGSTAAVLRVFRVLRIEVGRETLRARFGPWGLTIPGQEIESARVARYRWLSYGGWGLRWRGDGGRAGRACSVPFLRTGGGVDTLQGRRHYLNSRRPDELAADVNRLAEEARRS